MEDVASPVQHMPTAALQPLPVASDETLLAQVAAGDHAAFTTLYDSVAAAVYGLVRRIVVDVPAADRVTEDVLLAVWTLAGSFDGSAGTARGWILGLAHRHAVDEIRVDDGATQLSMVASDSPPAPGAASSADSAEPTVSGIEMALRCLPATQRSALELAYFQGLTYWQVARTLDISRSRATDTLRDALRGLATQPESPAPTASPR